MFAATSSTPKLIPLPHVRSSKSARRLSLRSLWQLRSREPPTRTRTSSVQSQPTLALSKPAALDPKETRAPVTTTHSKVVFSATRPKKAQVRETSTLLTATFLERLYRTLLQESTSAETPRALLPSSAKTGLTLIRAQRMA